MIIFIEPLGKPYNHLAVVKSFLFAFGKNSKDKKILFVSSKEYFESIPIIFRENLNHVGIGLSNSTIKNIFKIVFITLKILYKHRRSLDLKIFLLMSKSYSNLILKILSIFILRKHKIYILIHGELQNIDLKGTFFMNLDGRIQKMTYFLDTIIKSNLKFLIISNFVYKNLEDILGYKPKNITGIDLPYFYDDNKIEYNINKSKLVISTVGVNSIKKNSQMLNELAIHFKDKIALNLIEFCTTSRSDGIIFNDLIITPKLKNNYLLSSEDYANLIKKSDILIYFNDESYNMISSGSYFDAINFKKPILALRNTQWEYNFKEHGEIGFLCQNIDEIIDKINQILLNNSLLNKYHLDLEKAYKNTNILNHHSELILKLE
jgi:glycosyltransferase involved in cell wall biosynthesis